MTNKDKVLKLMLTQATYKQIAEFSGLTKWLVKYYTNIILQENDVNSRVQLIAEMLGNNFKLLETSRKLSELDDGVMTFILYGYSMQETADHFNIAMSEVKNARQRIFRATGCNSSLEMVCKCYGVEWVNATNHNLEGD